MTDILERLRSDKWQPSVELELLCRDAADEIERLRVALWQAAKVIEAVSNVDDAGPFISLKAMEDHAKAARAALAHDKETTP